VRGGHVHDALGARPRRRAGRDDAGGVLYRSTTTPWLPPKGYAPWTPQPWTRWTKHQYSGNGGYRVRGIVGDCDRDIFNGDLDAFKA
jgi:hypothetical protein